MTIATKLMASKVYDLVKHSAEQIRNNEIATIECPSPGDVIRQGDLYIVVLDVKLAGKPFGSRQLAPGNTQGSRHILEGDCEILTVDAKEATAVLNRLIPATKKHQQFIGPLILAHGDVTFTHPEHGWRIFHPGIFLTTYQRAWANELRRQRD